MTARAPLGRDHSAALAWLDEQLAARGVERHGDVALERERPWASVFRVETAAGVLWLKECGHGTRFEVGLYDVLRRVAPSHVVTPVAVDVDHAWMILPDGGRLLADEPDPVALLRQLEDAFTQYAELQRDVAAHVDELLAVGVADMRPAIMPQRFDEAMRFVSPYLAERGTDAERAAYQRLQGLRPAVADWSRRLASAPGGASLDHNDLHQWNVFYDDRPPIGRDRAWASPSRRTGTTRPAVPGKGVTRGLDQSGGPVAAVVRALHVGEVHDDRPGGAARFYDWGDAVVAHPFASMLVGLGALKRVHGFDDQDPRMVRLRDAYLAGFGDLAPHAELVETLELACRTGQIARALVWARAVGEMGAAAPDTYQTAPMQHLANLLEASYLGRH